MEKEQSKKATLRIVLRWIIQVFSTFLYVFFIMGSIFVFTAGINTSRFLLPCFILPAYLISITFGSEYLIDEDPVRRWSYCISIIITSICLFFTNSSQD